MKVKSISHVPLLETPWTAAYQAPPSMGFSRQEYWSGVPLPSPKTYYNARVIKTEGCYYNIISISEKAMAPHSNILAWKISWMEEPGRLQGVAKSQTPVSDFTFTFMHWRRKWQPTRVLAWRIPGMGDPNGLQSMGLHRVGHD